MTEQELQAIRERERAATPGPWDAIAVAGLTTIVQHESRNTLVDYGRHTDRVFIAHAREDIPALLAEIDRLRAQLEAEK